LPHAQQDGLDVVAVATAARLDGPPHLVDGVFLQQVQHTDVVPAAATGAVLTLQGRPQRTEDGRQLPAPEDIGVVQRRRPALQGAEVVLRVEDLLVLTVGARGRGDYPAAGHDVNAVDVALDGHRLEGSCARHAVAVVVEARHLELIDLGRLADARVEGIVGKGQGIVTLTREAGGDGLGLAGLDTLAVAQAAGAQVGVQFGQVVDPGHGRGPVTLQVTHASLDVRLLLRLADQAEERLEGVVTGQGLVAVVEATRPAGEQVRRHGARVVPPQLAWHAAEEGEGFDQAVQNGFGALGRHGDGERAVGVCPGDQQDGHPPPAVGEIDVDVAEVRLETLAGVVVERDKRHRLGSPLAPHVVADALVAAGVAVLVAQATHDLGDRMSLLAGRRLVVAEDGVDDRLEGVDDGRHGSAPVGLGLGLGKDLADLAA
jgi:hypothetical protein